MAALAGDLSKAILGQSDAAKAFRPWWDVLEDNLLYSFVIFGKKISIIIFSKKGGNGPTHLNFLLDIKQR